MARVGSSGSGGGGGAPVATVSYLFGEITNVASGIETPVNSFTASGVGTTYLQWVQMAGSNMAQFNIYLNGSTIDRAYLSLTEFNAERNYFTGNVSTPGLKLNNGDIVLVTVIQSRPSLGAYNAVIQVIQQ